MNLKTSRTVHPENRNIPLYTSKDFEEMREAGRLASQTLDFITPYVTPGISTAALDSLCHDFIINHGAVPAPLNYRGFPKSICTSLNHVVCHGIPSEERILKKNDILNIDVTVILNGWYGDTSRMFTLGAPSLLAEKLINTTYDCLMSAISILKPGLLLEEIGAVIEKIAKKNGFSSVRDFCGHGVGLEFHGEPAVLHYKNKQSHLHLMEGMIFTIEPMINAGTHETLILSDGWTAVTRDKKLSAQFEHSIGITEDGYVIFTLS